jgi:hypothetical protein
LNFNAALHLLAEGIRVENIKKLWFWAEEPEWDQNDLKRIWLILTTGVFFFLHSAWQNAKRTSS